MTSIPFNVPINNDDALDDNEEFRLTIALSSLHNRVDRVTPFQAVVTIVDNSSKYITYSKFTNYIRCAPIKIITFLSQPKVYTSCQYRTSTSKTMMLCARIIN